MTVQNLLSVCLFALFVIMVLIRAAVLRKRGIQVIVFGQIDKSDFLLVPLVLAIAYAELANTFGLPIYIYKHELNPCAVSRHRAFILRKFRNGY